MVSAIETGGSTPIQLPRAWSRVEVDPFSIEEAALPKYLITDDLDTTATYLTLSSNHPNRVSTESLDRVRSILAGGIEEALRTCAIEYFSVSEMNARLLEISRDLQEQQGLMVVSLDGSYLSQTQNKNVFPLNVTRLYDENSGWKIGRGQRPYHLYFEKQVEKLVRQSEGRSIAIVDSGLVTGGTIESTIEEITNRGGKVEAVYTGIAMAQAVDDLQAKYPDVQIHALTAIDSSVIDWTEGRDFLAFVPNSGQTIGRPSKVREGQCIPLFSKQYRCGYTIPYPLGRENRWASLDNQGTAMMRVVGLRASRELFLAVEQANRSVPFKFKHLLSIGRATDYQVKTTMPWMLLGYGPVAREIDPDTRIVDLVDRILENVYVANNTEILIPESVTTHRLYPGGNETALITTPVDRLAYPEVARRLLEVYPDTEQVGFVENLGRPLEPNEHIKLHMAGGEFCGNAARSLVWWLHNSETYNNPDGRYIIEVSGATHPLRTSVDQEGKVTVEMPVKLSFDSVKQLDNFSYLVEMEGIAHLVVFSNDIENKTMEEADSLLASLDLKKEKAAGIIYTEQTDDRVGINPFVHVAAVGSLYNETACASGTTALGLVLALRDRKNITSQAITQPSGEKIAVSVGIGKEGFTSASISEKVKFLDTNDTNIKRG